MIPGSPVQLINREVRKERSIRDFSISCLTRFPAPFYAGPHTLPSLPFVAYIFLETFLVCDMPGHIQLQLNSNIPKLISSGTLDEVSALLPGDLF